MLHEMFWQRFVDLWSLAHCWGWGIATYAVMKATKNLRFAWASDNGQFAAGNRWNIHMVDRPTMLLILAIAAGGIWEIAEKVWVEPWLGFHEPFWNRICDVLFDSAGSAIGVWVAQEKALTPVEDSLE